MAITWNDFTYLTPAQRAKMEQFRIIGLALDGGTPDISVVNDNQAKSAANFLQQDLDLLLLPTKAGVRYVRQSYRDNVVKNYEDSVTPGP